MSDNLGILTTSGVVSNAAQAGPGFAILGDLTNKDSPQKTTSVQKSLSQSDVISSVPHFRLLSPAPLVNEDKFDVFSEDISSSDEEVDLLDEDDLCGIDIEEAYFSGKVIKKNKAKKAYRSSKNPRHQAHVKKGKAVGLAKKRANKERSVQRTKDVTSKRSKLEVKFTIEHMVEDADTPTEIVVCAPRPVKAVSDTVDSFDNCVEQVPEIPSLPAISVSNNKSGPLLLANEEEEEEILVAIPRQGLITRGLRFAKRLVAKAVKFVKSAFKAAKNIVSC